MLMIVAISLDLDEGFKIGLPVRNACVQSVEIFIHLMTVESIRQIER